MSQGQPEPKVTTLENGKEIHFTAGAVIERDGRYLLLERAQFPPGFAGPAGHVDVGEEAEIAVVRELLEETGLVAKETAVVFAELMPGNTCGYGVTSHRWTLFRVAASGDPDVDAHEAKSWGWFTPEEIAKLDLEDVWRYWFQKLGIIE